MTSVVIDNIGQLVTGDPTLGDGPLGVRHGAALVLEDGLVVAISAAGKVSADERIDAAGACVMPAFVDSHTHLVFAGDRADEFIARMAGQPYEAGGIRVTTNAVRNSSTDQLRVLTEKRRGEARRHGIGHLEIKSGYGLDVSTEERCCALAAEMTDDVTFLGAHVVPAEYTERPDDYVELVCGPMLDACARHAKWIDVFCERGAFDVDQSRAILEAGRAKGLGLRIHANQLGFGPGVELAVEMGAASADHCTYLTDDDLVALAGSRTIATFLPAADFSTRQPYPDGRRAINAGVSIALATNCNPGSSYTTSMAFVLALAVREMGLTTEEAISAATTGGARALGRTDGLGTLAVGAPAKAVLLDAPSFAHLVYRPGVNLVARLID